MKSRTRTLARAKRIDVAATSRLNSIRLTLAAVKGVRRADKFAEQYPGLFKPDSPTPEAELVSSHMAYMRGEDGPDSPELEFQRLGQWLARRIWDKDHKSIQRLAVRLEAILAAMKGKHVRTRAKAAKSRAGDVVIDALSELFENASTQPHIDVIFEAAKDALRKQSITPWLRSNFYRFLRANHLAMLLDPVAG